MCGRVSHFAAYFELDKMKVLFNVLNYGIRKEKIMSEEIEKEMEQIRRIIREEVRIALKDDRYAKEHCERAWQSECDQCKRRGEWFCSNPKNEIFEKYKVVCTNGPTI